MPKLLPPLEASSGTGRGRGGESLSSYIVNILNGLLTLQFSTCILLMLAAYLVKQYIETSENVNKKSKGRNRFSPRKVCAPSAPIRGT